jgi:hypothetical protein
VAALREGRVVTIATLTVRGSVVTHIDALADPTRLAPLGEALGLSV